MRSREKLEKKKGRKKMNWRSLSDSIPCKMHWHLSKGIILHLTLHLQFYSHMYKLELLNCCIYVCNSHASTFGPACSDSDLNRLLLIGLLTLEAPQGLTHSAVSRHIILLQESNNYLTVKNNNNTQRKSGIIAINQQHFHILWTVNVILYESDEDDRSRCILSKDKFLLCQNNMTRQIEAMIIDCTSFVNKETDTTDLEDINSTTC